MITKLCLWFILTLKRYDSEEVIFLIIGFRIVKGPLGLRPSCYGKDALADHHLDTELFFISHSLGLYFFCVIPLGVLFSFGVYEPLKLSLSQICLHEISLSYPFY